MEGPSTVGLKRGAEEEPEEASDQKRPDFKDVVQSSVESSSIKGFALKPSTLKAPSIKLPESKGRSEEPSESIVFAGFKPKLEPDKSVFGGLGTKKSPGMFPNPNLDLSTSQSAASRIFGSNLTQVVSTSGSTGLSHAETSASVTSVFGAGLKDRIVDSLSVARQLEESPHRPVLGSTPIAHSEDLHTKPIFGSFLREKVIKSTADDQTENPKDDGQKGDIDAENEVSLVGMGKDNGSPVKCDSGDSPISVKESVTKSSPTIETVFGSRDQSSLSSFPEFHHQTGEENEKVVLQFQAKLFTFEKETQSWKEKGRGLISLNDICQSTSEGIFQSRLVMRMSGSRRLILNTNMWTEMKCEKADSRRVRFTGQDFDTGQIRIFLLTGESRSIGNLYSAMEKRLFAMRKSTERTSDDNSDQESNRPTAVSPPLHPYKVGTQDGVQTESLSHTRAEIGGNSPSVVVGFNKHTTEEDSVLKSEGKGRVAVIVDSTEEGRQHNTEELSMNSTGTNTNTNETV